MLRLEARGNGIGKGTRAQRVPEREVVILDAEDVREVGGELEPDLELDGLHRSVLEDHHILHALADEPLARHQHLVLTQSAGERVAQEESGREVLDLARRERQRRRSVERQLQPREKPRVLGEQTTRLVADVADVVEMQKVDPSRIVNISASSRDVAAFLAPEEQARQGRRERR